MNNNKIVFKNEAGEETSYDIIAMITNKIDGRNIVYFTDNKVDANGSTIVYGTYFAVENNQIKLLNEFTEANIEALKDLYNEISYSEKGVTLSNINDSNIANNPYTDIEVL